MLQDMPEGISRKDCRKYASQIQFHKICKIECRKDVKDMPGKMPGAMPERMSEGRPAEMPEDIPEDMLGRMPEDVRDRTPERKLEDMAGRR